MSVFYNQEFSLARTAKELLQYYPSTYQKDGYYMLWPTGSRIGPGQLVYCDMTTDGGGWMMIARTHPSTINYNGQNWGWRGGKIGSVKDFSQAYQAGWYNYWDPAGNSFTEFIFGNRSNINDSSWGPFIYKRYGLTYSTFINSDTLQSASTSTLKSNAAVYGDTGFPGMQSAIGFPVTGTSNNIYYMRDCCGFAGYGGTPTSMSTTYCGASFYYAGAWCGGSTTDSSGNFQNGTYVSNGLTFGGTNQYMIMVR
jgi:hypothetical protein